MTGAAARARMARVLNDRFMTREIVGERISGVSETSSKSMTRFYILRLGERRTTEAPKSYKNIAFNFRGFPGSRGRPRRVR